MTTMKRSCRVLAMGLIAGGAFAFLAPSAEAQTVAAPFTPSELPAMSDMDAQEATHDGVVVSISGDQLVMKSQDGAEHSHTIVKGAKLSLDGKTCKETELKPGMKIRVSTKNGNESMAEGIEGIQRNAQFADAAHDGKLVSVSGQSLVMTDNKGLDRRTCPMTPSVKITCDGKACKWSDLKPGAYIRVTCQEKAPHAATKIEAIEKNQKFASL